MLNNYCKNFHGIVTCLTSIQLRIPTSSTHQSSLQIFFLFDCVCSRDYLDSVLQRGLIWYDCVEVLFSGNSLLTKLKHSMLEIPLSRGSGKI